jgi:diguanylate cyclase (GGDEF)-like protein
MMFVASAIALLLSQAMVLLSLALKGHRGPGYWAAGSSGLAGFTFLIALQGTIPPLYGLVIANVGVIVSLCLACHGLVIFLERPPRRAVYGVVCLVTVLGFVYSSLVQPSFAGRALTFSLAYGYLMGDTAWVLYRQQENRREPCYLFVQAAFVIPVLFCAARVAMLLPPHPPATTLLQQSAFGALVLLIYILNTVILFVGLIMLASSRFARELERANTALTVLSSLDGLTGLFNRRQLDLDLEEEYQRAARDGRPLGVILVDIDHFKPFNDTYGHQNGDECLKRVATAIREAVARPGDRVARYGGEEFAVILPGANLAGTAAVAEGIRRRVESLDIGHPCSATAPRVTISLGVASIIPRTRSPWSEIVAQADQALYEAKRRGRNRVEVFEGTPLPA